MIETFEGSVEAPEMVQHSMPAVNVKRSAVSFSDLRQV
jgi:hypothetical protein